MNTESNTSTTTTDETTGTNVIVLETPIQRGEQVIRSVRLRKPTAGDLRGIKLFDLAQMDVTALTTVLPRISQPILTTADAGKLEPADLIEIARVIGDFFVPKAEKESLPA
ncbi:phage tail assembly protein [Stenotrophomonas maltophilia]|uniref:phage tail assembly protein n=1 Tax=Stenotrophomonas maltophilia TaxID=40324 RepID=UPI0021C71672|nr:phage tail assembly protein [Stenotrophomonas maltophilia]MCU1128914.1 phage tail assembly protein [Stenotrophomonas maltophilia]